MPASLVLAVSLALFPADASDQASLEALAASSGRPRECTTSFASKGGKRRGKRPSVWQRARDPELVPYCDLVARAHTLLESDAKAALDAAEKAAALWPQHAGALLAQGRALLGLGRAKEALERFDAAKAIDKLALEEPHAMRAYARAFIANGNVGEGAALYRTLVPRASLLPDRLRASVMLEAAYASMAEAGKAAAGSGKPSADSLVEALAFAGEARSLNHASLTADVLLALALLHDRAGEAEKASALLREGKGLVRASPGGEAFVADKADLIALKALTLELESPAEAQKQWALYQEAGIDAFKRAAKARSAALSSGGPKAKAR